MLKKLVERLPFMILPSWTQNASKPVAISDVVKSIEFCLGMRRYTIKSLISEVVTL